jgi:hypothetical protein
MGFGIADILHRVCCRFAPNSLSANNIDHIIKSPPLMSRDAPVM